MSDDLPERRNRRQFLKGLVVLGGVGTVAAFGSAAVWRSVTAPAAPHPKVGPDRPPSLDVLTDAVTPGGPGKDGIPAIDRPRFVPAGDAAFLTDDALVFGLVHRGETRAYPQLVLVWHEIVNDTVAGEPLAVTYCPLTGTTIGFTGVTGGPALTFGTTGNLVNSNLLMYDRETGSEWPQLLGVAIRGPHRGRRLGSVPLVWTTWKAWRARHPHTLVLSTDTGYLRSYGRDPYGSYQTRGGYYVEDDPFFPVLATDNRFPAKDVVIGVRIGDATLALHKEFVRQEKAVPAVLAGTSLIASWDEGLDTVRVRHEGSVPGVSADVLDAMWFAWYAFHPDTEVIR